MLCTCINLQTATADLLFKQNKSLNDITLYDTSQAYIQKLVLNLITEFSDTVPHRYSTVQHQYV